MGVWFHWKVQPCPHCGKKARYHETEYVCSDCGHTFNPHYVDGFWAGMKVNVAKHPELVPGVAFDPVAEGRADDEP